CASVDLISAVIDLCERRWARINAGEVVEMHPEASVVATLRTSSSGGSSMAADAMVLLSSIRLHVTLPPFSEEELRRIICVKYGRVAAVARKLIVIFDEVVAVNAEIRQHSRRMLTSTDLFRACERLQHVTDLADNIAILGELSDVWALHCASFDDLMQLSQIISKQLSVSREQLEYYLNLRMPSISVEREHFTCGRAKVKVSKQTDAQSKRSLLGVTRDVCQLMERVAVCIDRNEPVLLVGETGVGKTSVVQSIAAHANVTLRVVNLSQHSDSSDLIGGYKPVSLNNMLQPLKSCYDQLFLECFDVQRNAKFLSKCEKCLKAGRYADFASIMSEIARRAIMMPSKADWHPRWANVLVRAERLKQAVMKTALPFAYVRGVVAEAVERGDWLLVDEINLAPSECIDAIVHVMDDATTRNSKFRLFACMNPATDTGKRNLPEGVRTRFTEIFVRETTDMNQLSIIGHTYLPALEARRLNSVLELYRALREMLPGKYSLRTLCRALSLASANLFGGEVRSLCESISMSFLNDMDAQNRSKVEKMIAKCVGKVPGNPIPKPPTPSLNGRDYINVEGYWVEAGIEQPKEDPHYVCTASVKRHLADLARIVCSGRYPVLLEGETSAGKTAMITHLARITGNTLVRINNHEHTDLQEYIGSYAPDAYGRLTFVEGALLKAVRAGHWVILDELNLAPTDVIEALNRLLDENRELFVSELNEAVKAHPSFRLFATQNPVSAYAGRKRLSRALISRFVVLRFDHLPFDELAQMVVARCAVAPSSAHKMVSVLCDLRAQRSLMGVFSARDGLMTLRDVFRWAKRLALSDQTDWQQCLADQGFFLLAARCRNVVDESLVKATLEKHLKRTISAERLFAMDSVYMPSNIRNGDLTDCDIELTSTMRRMIVLCAQAWRCNEPVLMVGDTGCGKTTVADIIAKGKLLSVNCHERTETSDFLGSLRPIGDGTFRWVDGIVVEAMKEGRPLLIDEISLAADSVLERLNPLLEPSRLLLLTDAGTVAEQVEAKDGFNIVATMNPGGDYGKKELSKALRNRFTEFWCPSELNADDMKSIILRRMRYWTPREKMPSKECIATCLVQFVTWFSSNYSHIFRCRISIRDVVAATELFVSCVDRAGSVSRAFYHAISATILDALGAVPTRMSFDRLALVDDSIRELNAIMRRELQLGFEEVGESFSVTIHGSSDEGFIVSDFVIPFGPLRPSMPATFTFEAPTCKRNVYRLARALSINKPILMEGAPGCGKSSTVVALAAATGHPLTRLNLSDQTDLSDLFGSDVPIVLEDGSASFAWKDGPVLNAIKNGHWILLDEMNLASQSVLEGLNACLDHRRQLFIAELNRTFEVGAGSGRSRFFACQNPRKQGGNRRALPKSFVNRFTSIYAEDLTADDERIIIGKCFSRDLDEDVIAQMVAVKETIVHEISTDGHFASDGAPFEFNLRDLLRWAELTVKSKDIAYAFDLIFVRRLRTPEDRRKMRNIFVEKFGLQCLPSIASVSISRSRIRIGKVELSRMGSHMSSQRYLLSSQLTLLEHLAICVHMNWLTLLVGKTNIGKASIVQILADLTGTKLYTMRLTSETDALELLGSFEQVTDYVDLAKVKNGCARLLSNHKGLRDAVLKCEDSLALRLSLQSAAYLVDGETATHLNGYVEALYRNTMRFEWVNSNFLDAYANGYWILVENVNCCSAAVLDRLNTCLESNGTLILSERGDSEQSISAHPNFRVFFTMDPANGSISRAMRNRSIELFISPEENGWYHRASDILSIVSPEQSDEHLMKAFRFVLDAGVHLTPEQLLQLKVLLQGMPLEQVLKAVNVKGVNYMEVDSESAGSGSLLRYPLVSDGLLTTLDDWKCAVWKMVCTDGDLLLGAVWCLLSATPHRIISGKLRSTFPSDYVLLSGLMDIIQSNRFDDEFLPFDERFEGPLALRLADRIADFSLEDKIILRAFNIWIWAQMKAIKSEDGSAACFSTAFLKKEILIDELPSECVRYVSGFIDELLHLFPNSYCNLPCSFNLLIESAWNVLLFVRTACEKLHNRTGCASMHIAWQRLSGTFAVLPFSSANLKHLTDRLSDSWSIVNEVELSRFLDFYKERRIVEPFKDRESWLQASKFIDEVKREPMDTKLPHAAKGCEQSARKEKLMESAFQGALKMTSDIFGSFALLKREDSREAVTEVCGHMTLRPIVLQRIGAFDWKDERWSRIAHWLTFLSDDFAVNEFPIAFKNIDLSRCCLGTELMINVWRSLHFDASLRAVTLDEFGNFASERDRFSFLLWKLAPHLGGLNEIIRQRLTSVLSHLGALIGSDEPIDASTSTQSLTKQLLPTGLALMRLATPVSNMVDPVISEELTYFYLKRKLDLINTQLSIVQRYQSVMSGQDALMLYAKSRHPLMAALNTSHREITDEMNAYTEKLRGFRPSYNDFTRVALEMSSFLRMTIEWCGNVSVEFSGWENRSCEQLEMKKAQFESFLVSAITFCNRVINEYSAYPDVVQPFLLGVHAVMLSISYLRSEIAAVMNVRRLMFEYSIPPSFKLELDTYTKNEQLLNWCLSEKSIMPKRLQLSLVYSGIRQSGNMAVVHLCTSWIEREWSKWYEKNTQREEKSFVYRKSGKKSEQVDEESLEVLEIFPDYSSWSEEGVEEVAVKGEGNAVREELLGEEDLANLLREFLQPRNGDLGDTYLPLMWLIDATAGSFTIDINVDTALIVSHLVMLKNLGETAHERVIDVYKANSPKELLRCVEAINKLNGRLETLREEWPEMTVIGDILQVSERILKSVSTLSQMQFAALLERLLSEAEHWEKIADRKHSISNELNVLREILVDWRKMEVLCWSELLQRVQRCCGDEALLISWPLFDALKNTERRNEDVLAMSIEWIQHSTLLDFDARLISLRLLARYAHLSSRVEKEQLAKQILSTAAYFDQYFKIILSRFETLKSPIETQLREFVKIVKYNDLNLWSVKLSAQKAHQQLFRIVKQFKLCGNEPIAPLIDDLLPVPEVNDDNTVTWNVEEVNDCDEALVKRASQVAREVAERLHAEFSTNDLNELLELTVDCDQLIRKEIVYEGEEEEKEKQQARALDERQKAISLLFKRCAEFGIRFRRGLLVDAEEMTATSVTGIVGNDCLLRKLVRQSAASRSTVLKSLHKPNKQLSVHTISRLKGITEFALKEMLAFNADLSLRDETTSRIQSALRMLRIHAENIQNTDSECIDHQQWYSSLRLIKLESLEKLRLLVSIMISKLECAPREQYAEYSEMYEISALTDTPLSKLHAQDPEYSVVKSRVESARSSIERMVRAVDDALATCEGCEEIVVWKRDEMCALSDLLRMEGEPLCSNFVELTQWMNDECVEAIALTQRVMNLCHFTVVDIGAEHSNDHCHPSFESLLLTLQYAYKRTLNMAKAESESNQVTVQVLDRIRSIMSIARSANFEKSLDALWALCSHISRGCTLKEDLEKAISLTSSLLSVFHLLFNGIERFMLQFALYYLHFESIAVQLLRKGYVNAIPKLEEQSEGKDGKLMASDEPAGMGDAQGDHDVGDEMDEMGQIEGLKGESEHEGEKSERQRDEDKPI
uniref:Midasin n=2 Tax=Parascaris univalens TaxID=6257 RepID=A0A914ZUI6_PARUN